MKFAFQGSACTAYRILALLSVLTQAQLDVNALEKERATSAKPSIEISPTTLDASIGETVMFECRVNGETEVNITWTRPSDKNITAFLEDGRITTANGSLTIEKIQETDKGRYFCQIETDKGIVSASAKLKLKSKPRFRVSPADVTVSVGQRVTVRCKVAGYPSPTVFWSRGTGQHLLFPSQERGRFFVDRNGTLIIQAAEEKDTGTYNCQAVNAAGSAVTSAHITVVTPIAQYPPVINLQPKNINQSEGSTILISCNASGVPQPIVHWYHDGQPIVLSDSRVKKLKFDTLQITDLRSFDAGVYTCKAANIVGETTQSAIISVQARACPCIQTPNDGAVTLLGNRPGDVARFACDRGYSLVGQEYVHCTTNGLWSDAPPICTDGAGSDGVPFATCYILVPNNHTLFFENYNQLPSNFSAQLPHGTELKSRCEDIGKFTFYGEHNIACTNGEWTVDLPYCVPNIQNTGNSTPIIDIRVKNGQHVITPDGRLAVRPGAKVILTCRYNGTSDLFLYWVNEHRKSYPTKETKDSGLQLIIANIDQSESGEYSCLNLNQAGRTTIVIAVEDWICPEAIITSENVILLEEDNKFGGKAKFKCAEGYTMEGSETSYCRIGGKWHPSAPTCSGSVCPCVETSPNVVARTERNSRSYRTYFSCLPGYSLEGSNDVVCRPSGNWSSQAPKCVEVDCGPPPGFIEGRLVGNQTTLGSIFYFWCNTGVIPPGWSRFTRCQADGKWSHQPPSCMELRCNQSESKCFSMNCTKHAHFMLPRDADNRHWGCCGQSLYDMRTSVCERGSRLLPCSEGYSCDNGNCVRHGVVCDGNNDCSDGTDERGCDPCHGKQFRCSDGQCVDFRHVCDRDKNCIDGTDEAGCARGWATIGQMERAWCQMDEFTCPGDRVCLSLSKICDGHYDCDGGYDEERCGVAHCNPRVETCRTVTCPEGEPAFVPVRTRYVEWGCCRRILYSRRTTFCSSRGVYPCPEMSFRCNNGNCVPPSWQCDSENDCSDGTDEAGCYGCQPDEYNCGDRQCVHVSRVCDKQKDCYNGMDECNCARSDGQWCGGKQYRCFNDKCIAREKVCNHVDDCGDKSDEIKCVPD